VAEWFKAPVLKFWNGRPGPYRDYPFGEAIEFHCAGRAPGDRAAIADELVALVRSIARGDYPEPQTSLFDRDEHARESWARMCAHHVVDGALAASEPADGPLPSPDQIQHRNL